MIFILGSYAYYSGREIIKERVRDENKIVLKRVYGLIKCFHIQFNLFYPFLKHFVILVFANRLSQLLFPILGNFEVLIVFKEDQRKKTNFF